MLVQLFLRTIARPLVWLRYRVEVDGLDRLRQVRGPALVLPNHAGHIDPVLVMSQLGAEIPLRPLVVSFMYQPFYLNPLMRFINALEVPDLVSHSQSAREQVEPMINAVVEGLDCGGKFVIYTAGRIERNGMEHLLEWHLIYRDEFQLEQVLPAQREATKLYTDATGVNVFAEFRTPGGSEPGGSR